MSLLLKITLSVLTVLIINGSIGMGMYITVKDSFCPLAFIRGKYGLISMILMLIAICYIPFMFIWHLY